MTKRETEQRRRDLEAGQRAFDAWLTAREQQLVIDALHAEQIELIVVQAHWGWNDLLQHFANDEEQAGSVIEQWKVRIGRAPQHVHYELEWADSLFEAAATAWVNHEVLLAVRNWGPDRARGWVTDRLISLARPGSSSSGSHNLMGHFEAKALGHVLETLKGW